jgi:hypothetical protein
MTTALAFVLSAYTGDLTLIRTFKMPIDAGAPARIAEIAIADRELLVVRDGSKKTPSDAQALQWPDVTVATSYSGRWNVIHPEQTQLTLVDFVSGTPLVNKLSPADNNESPKIGRQYYITSLSKDGHVSTVDIAGIRPRPITCALLRPGEETAILGRRTWLAGLWKHADDGTVTRITAGTGRTKEWALTRFDDVYALGGTGRDTVICSVGISDYEATNDGVRETWNSTLLVATIDGKEVSSTASRRFTAIEGFRAKKGFVGSIGPISVLVTRNEAKVEVVDTSIQRWTVQPLRVEAALKISSPVTKMRLSPDDSLLAALLKDGTVAIIRTSGMEVLTLRALPSGGSALAWSEDGKNLVVGTDVGEVHIFSWTN